MTRRWPWTRIQTRTETATELDFDIEEARQMLVPLEVDTWGIVLRGIAGGRVVVPSSGTLVDPASTVRDRPVVRSRRGSEGAV